MKSVVAIAALALVDARHHHRHHAPHSLAQKKLHREYESPFYHATKEGANWFDLDDPHERLHGTQYEDFNTAYDPEVVDAPEDMPRVGNDHETLHNGKLSPDGYYTGFFHKDY